MRDREAQHSLLDHPRELVWHLRLAPLTRPEDLETVTFDLALPGVLGRSVHTEHAAGSRTDVRPLSEQLKAVAEQHVILQHLPRLLFHLA
jgi:hypothetical protein